MDGGSPFEELHKVEAKRGVQFTSKAPFEQFNAAAIEMNSALKALNGG